MIYKNYFDNKRFVWEKILEMGKQQGKSKALKNITCSASGTQFLHVFRVRAFMHFAVPPLLGPQASEKDSKKGIKKGNDVISHSLHCELLWNGWSAVDY